MPNFALMRTLIVSIVGLAVFYSEGVFFDTTSLAQSLITAATSLGYPRTGQDKAVVVLFTEDDLTDFVKADEVSFPIPYRLHADVLRSIANAKPEAIFIDFAFIQQTRAHDEQFAALKLQVCRAHRTVIHEDGKPDRLTKVFVVDTSQLGLAGITAETFGGCATPVGAFIDREHIAVGVMTYPKSGNAPPGDGSALEATVPTGAPCGCTQAACGNGLSAAYALWLSTQPCLPDGTTKADGDGRPLPTGETMAVIWPALPPPNETAIELCKKPPGVEQRFRLLWRDGPEALKRGCPYTRTVTAGDLLRPVAGDEVDRHLYHRVVFYGSKLAMSADFIRSPVFSEQPAVYYHALAFDNLVSFHGRPKEPAGRVGKVIYGLVLVLVAALLSFLPEAEKPKPAADQVLTRYGWIGRGIFLLLAFGAFGVIFQITFLETNAPEYLLLGAFVLFVVERFAKAPRMGWLAVACFAISMGLYVYADLSFEKFIAMILCFEIIHALLHHLRAAADKVRTLYDVAPDRPVSLAERVALWILKPFLTHKEQS